MQYNKYALKVVKTLTWKTQTQKEKKTWKKFAIRLLAKYWIRLHLGLSSLSFGTGWKLRSITSNPRYWSLDAIIRFGIHP